jgi:hypothetical protein
MVMLLAVMLLTIVSDAGAMDFKVKGQWLMGFVVGEDNLVAKNGKTIADNEDRFGASQRLQLKLDAAASEFLSGTVFIEIGKTHWGKADGYTGGAALGADSANIIKLKNAYLDWTVPDTNLALRMGVQYLALPNKAGGSGVFDADVAGITASYKINENAGVTAVWMRPFNDNYTGARQSNYLDNMDLLALTVPMKFDGFEVTPWLMYGIRGKNTGKFDNYQTDNVMDGLPTHTYGPYPSTIPLRNGWQDIGGTDKTYGSMFWAGLPLVITALEPFNIELDFNYGHIEGMGRYDASKWNGAGYDTSRSSTRREGWLVKALVEYAKDWGTPGIFAWYGSGDDDDPKNGSERMPTIAPYGNFTSFLGDGNMYWAPDNAMIDQMTSYSGTWGVGARIRNVSFVENLNHSLTVAWWGGTNAAGMTRYMRNAWDWNTRFMEGYMTVNDGLLEVSFIHEYQMYENFKINLELGYVANFMDNDTWSKAGAGDTNFEKQDMWKAQLIFAYQF